MCLSTVRSAEYVPAWEGRGYKVFCLIVADGTIHSVYFDKLKVVETGVEYSCGFPCDIRADDGSAYVPGFHAFETFEDAQGFAEFCNYFAWGTLEFTVRSVRLKGLLARGDGLVTCNPRLCPDGLEHERVLGPVLVAARMTVEPDNAPNASTLKGD